MSTASPMTRWWKMNLLLLLILLLAATGLWWLERQNILREKVELASRVISPMAALEVVRAQFCDQDGHTMTLEQRPQKNDTESRWQMVTPSATVRTNDEAVGRLLGILGKKYDRKVAVTAANLGLFGLETPVASLTVYNAAGHSFALRVGHVAPASKKRYLQVGDNGPVVMLADKVLLGVLQSWEELRDKRLFTNTVINTVKRITRVRTTSRSSRTENLALEKDQSGAWRMLEPIQDLVSTARLAVWLNDLTLAKGVGFAPVSVTEPKGTEQEWTFTMETTEGDRESVLTGRRAEDLLAWRTGEQDALLLDHGVSEELNKPVMELVALRPLADGIVPERLQITYQGKTLTEAKEQGLWPVPAWEGVEGILVRDAWRGSAPKQRGDVWMTIIAFQGQNKWAFSLWKEGETIFLVVPGRPIELELTHYQTEAFLDTLKYLNSILTAD